MADPQVIIVTLNSLKYQILLKESGSSLFQLVALSQHEFRILEIFLEEPFPRDDPRSST